MMVIAMRFNPDMIRIIRVQRGLTREEFAKRIGGSRQQVHAWETGKYRPSYGSISAIVSAMGLKSADVFFVMPERRERVGRKAI